MSIGFVKLIRTAILRTTPLLPFEGIVRETAGRIATIGTRKMLFCVTLIVTVVVGLFGSSKITRGLGISFGKILSL